MSKRKQNETTRPAGSTLDRRQFLGAGAALGAAGMGVMFAGLTRRGCRAERAPPAGAPGWRACSAAGADECRSRRR